MALLLEAHSVDGSLSQVDALPLGLRTPKTTLMGIEFHGLTEDAVVSHVSDSLSSAVGGSIATVHLEILRLCACSPEACETVRQADLVVADGQPLVWASRLQGAPLPERVTGSNLIWSLSAEAARTGRSIFLLGGRPGSGEAAAQRLSEASPGLRIAGLSCPPLGFHEDVEQLERVVDDVVGAQPNIVYIGLGFPKQERLIAELRRRLPAAWFLGVGVSIDFAAGKVRRAPPWMQAIGLEWLHRLAQEPRRLFKRYILHVLPFAPQLFADSAMRRWLMPS